MDKSAAVLVKAVLLKRKARGIYREVQRAMAAFKPNDLECLTCTADMTEGSLHDRALLVLPLKGYEKAGMLRFICDGCGLTEEPSELLDRALDALARHLDVERGTFPRAPGDGPIWSA